MGVFGDTEVWQTQMVANLQPIPTPSDRNSLMKTMTERVFCEVMEEGDINNEMY